MLRNEKPQCVIELLCMPWWTVLIKNRVITRWSVTPALTRKFPDPISPTFSVSLLLLHHHFPSFPMYLSLPYRECWQLPALAVRHRTSLHFTFNLHQKSWPHAAKTTVQETLWGVSTFPSLVSQIRASFLFHIQPPEWPLIFVCTPLKQLQTDWHESECIPGQEQLSLKLEAAERVSAMAEVNSGFESVISAQREAVWLGSLWGLLCFAHR